MNFRDAVRLTSGKSTVGRDAGLLVSDGQTSSPDHLLNAAESALQKGWGDLVTR